MPVPAVDNLLDALRQMQLVAPSRLDELARDAGQFAEARTLARHLLDRGLLTAFQVNHLLSDRAPELQLGPYLLLERLGEGSRGQVYKAEHQRMRRVVALKLIRKELLADGDAVQQFYQEIEAASQLSHPNIVHAYDAGPMGATHFLAMEYVEGTDLGRLVEQSGPLPWERACAYVAQAAAGLQHAYERGMVHRDIRPSSLFVTAAREDREETRGRTALKTPGRDAASWGVVKIMEFGQGRLHGAGRAQAAADFEAPEQTRDPSAADIRSDLYSLGATFHYLLTGKPPFVGDTVAPQGEATPWSDLEPPVPLPGGMPPAVEEVMRRMLALNPAQRYQIPGEVVEALARAAGRDLGLNLTSAPASSGALEVDERPPPPRAGRRAAEQRWQKAIIWGGGLVLFAGVAGLLAYFFMPRAQRPEDNPEPATPAAAELRRLESIINSRPEADEVWTGLLALRGKYPGTPEAAAAADWLRRVPSPLDKLKPDKIAEDERYGWQPKETVAVLGDQRWRQWTGAVRLLAVSPAGPVASAGDGDVVYVWDAATGRPQHILRTGHPRLVYALALSPDGKTLATGGDEGVIKLWNSATGAELPGLPKVHGGPVTSLAFSGDGKLLASGSHDKKVALWDVAGRKASFFPGDHKDQVFAVAFAPDGRTVASGSKDGALRLWDVEEKKLRRELRGHPGGLNVLAFDPCDAGQLASGGQDKVIRVWDTIAENELRALKNNDKPVTCLTYSPDGHRLVGGSNQDTTVRMWNLTAPHDKPPMHLAHGSGPQAVAFTADGKRILVGVSAWDMNAPRIWELTGAGPKALPAPAGHRRYVKDLAFTPDARTLVSHSPENDPHFWDLPAATDRSKPAGAVHGSSTMALAPDGQALVAPARDVKNALQRWNVSSGEPGPIFAKGHTDAVEALAYASDGKVVASGGRDKAVRLWDPLTGAEKATLPTQENTPGVLLFLPDGQVLAVGGSLLKSVTFWDLATAREKFSVRGLEYGTLCAALSADGKLLATAGRDNLVRVWELPSGKERTGLLMRSGQAVHALLFTPDGQNLVVAGQDGQILFTRLSGSGNSRQLSLPGPVHSLALAPDGRHLAAGGGNGAVYLLRLAPPSARGD